MSEEDLKVVFERFKRTEQAHKKYDGTGFGPGHYKGLLDLLGGSISVKSYRKGQRIYLYDPI